VSLGLKKSKKIGAHLKHAEKGEVKGHWNFYRPWPNARMQGRYRGFVRGGIWPNGP